MITHARPVLRAVAFALAVAALGGRAVAQQPARLPGPALTHLPVGSGVFLENRGQWATPSAYVARRGSWHIGIEPRALVMARTVLTEDNHVRGAVVRLLLEGASDATPVGEGRRPEPYHFLIGKDPTRWRTSVPAYDVVRLPSAGGVDLVVRWVAASPQLEWRVPPGCAVSEIVVRCEGADDVSLAPDGSLLMATSVGTVRQTPPHAWERSPQGEVRELAASFRIMGADRFGFAVTDRNPAREVVVAPGLEWSTFLKGEDSGSNVQCLGLTQDGGVTVCGRSVGPDFPVTPGAFDFTYDGGTGTIPRDLYVAHLDPTGSRLQWATYLGGTNNEDAAAMLVDADGTAIIAGHTSSRDWPTTSGAYQETMQGFLSGFVTAVAPDGASLEFSTFLGGSVIDLINDLTCDADGNLVVVGSTQSLDFPVTPNAFQATGFGYPGDAFLSVLDPEGGTLAYSTYLAGTGAVQAFAAAVDDEGLAYVAGTTDSTDFPVTPDAFQTEVLGFVGSDVFVSCFDLATGSLVASTLLGSDARDGVVDIAIDPFGLVVLAGYTDGFNPPLPTFIFPTTPDAFDTTYNAFEDMFVSKLTPDLTTLAYSTFIGGVDRDFAKAMVAEPSGAVVIVGDSVSSDFPTTAGCVQPTKANRLSSEYDLVVFRLSPSGDALHYSTYLGGSGGEGLGLSGDAALAVDAAGAATVGSSSSSDDFPTTPGSYDPTKDPDGPGGAVIARLSLLPEGVEAFGTSSPGCDGPMTLGVTSLPQIGNAGFALTCGGAPEPGVMGWMAVSSAPLSVPIPVAGADVWIDPGTLLLVPVTSRQRGYAEIAASLPSDARLVDAQAFVQMIFMNECAPPALSASNALVITLLHP